MEKWKSVLPVLLALVIASAGSWMTYRWVKKQLAQGQTSGKEEVQTVTVAVAKADLPWGTKLSRNQAQAQLELLSYLKESVPPGAFKDVESLDERVLVFPVKKGEPVLESSLAPVDVRIGGVAAILKPGKRALAVQGDKVIGLSGFVLPGNRVDVFVTLPDPRKDTEVTKLVLQDIPVLATGSELQENDKGDPMPVDVYTLEVTPQEGEKLALAAMEGKIQLGLRSAMDLETVLTKGATAVETLDSFKEVGPAPKRNVVPKEIKRGEKPFMRQVEVIRGNERSGQTFYQ
jgi:pilus assembly protein CpaB